MSLEPTATHIEARLRDRLQPTRLEVIDESYQHAGHVGSNGSGFGTHFRVRIASPLFTNCGRIARHRLVYDALQDFIDQGLHALAIEAEETSPATPSGVSV
jgi:BolA protein